LHFLTQHFGKSGPYFYGIARGINERQVQPDRVKKSVGAEDTFVQDINYLDAATGLLATVYTFKRRVRLLGVTLSSLSNYDATENDGQQ
jgi:DNA polymerase-4